MKSGWQAKPPQLFDYRNFPITYVRNRGATETKPRPSETDDERKSSVIDAKLLKLNAKCT